MGSGMTNTTDEELQQQERSQARAADEESPAALARGSASTLTPMQRIADPRLLARSSRSSLSAFQQRDQETGAQPRSFASERIYILGLVVVLLAATGVLTYFFLVS